MSSPDARKVFELILHEAMSLAIKWDIQKKLFGSGHETFELINSTAPSFFGYVQIVGQSDLSLSITRLLEGARDSFGNESLTIEWLLEQPDLGISDARRQECVADLAAMRSMNKKLKKLRNKEIAHADLVYATGAKALDRPTIAEIEEVLQSIWSLMNRIDGDINDRETGFELVQDSTGVRALLFYLKKGLHERSHSE